MLREMVRVSAQFMQMLWLSQPETMIMHIFSFAQTLLPGVQRKKDKESFTRSFTNWNIKLSRILRHNALQLQFLNTSMHSEYINC